MTSVDAKPIIICEHEYGDDERVFGPTVQGATVSYHKATIIQKCKKCGSLNISDLGYIIL